MQRNIEQLMFQRFFGGDQSWAQAVYLAGMFAIILWRRESIANPWLFRLSYLLYAAALVLPPVLLPLMQVLMEARLGNPNNQILIYILTNSVGPLLFAGAVICALGCMIPRAAILQSPALPQTHPLD